MAITARYVRNEMRYNKDFLLEEVGKYNKALAQAIKQNPSFSLLEPKSTEDFTGWSDAQIAKELNRMRDLLNPKNFRNVKYSADSKIKVAAGVKKELNALLRIGNKRAERRYNQFPDILGGKLDNIEKNRYAPITLGDGKDYMNIRKRAQTIHNRSRESFYQKGYLDNKYHFAHAMQIEFSPTNYKRIRAILDKIDPEDFYLMMQDPIYGDYLNFDFVYDKEIDAQERAKNIVHAINKLRKR